MDVPRALTRRDSAEARSSDVTLARWPSAVPSLLAATSCAEFNANPAIGEAYVSATAQVVGVDASQVTVECREVPTGGRKLRGTTAGLSDSNSVSLRIQVTSLSASGLLTATGSLFSSNNGVAVLSDQWNQNVRLELGGIGVDNSTGANWAPQTLNTISFNSTTAGGSFGVSIVTKPAGAQRAGCRRLCTALGPTLREFLWLIARMPNCLLPAEEGIITR